MCSPHTSVSEYEIRNLLTKVWGKTINLSRLASTSTGFFKSYVVFQLSLSVA